MKKIGFIGGHSDIKVGASGNGYKEHLEVRDIANRCIEYAKKNYEGTFITDNNKQHSGGGEEDFIIDNKLDYFISIHLNCSTNTTANGSEILVSTREKTTGIEEKMLKRICDEVGFKSRGIKRRQTGGQWIPNQYKDVNDYYGILRQPKAKGISGAILEICFISNKSDMEKFISNKDKIAKIIVESICEGFGIQKKVNIPQEPEKPLEKPSEAETLYRVCIGTFKSKENAVKFKNEAMLKGFKDAFIITD